LGPRTAAQPFHPLEEAVTLLLTKAPHHYQLEHTVEIILGRDFTCQKLDQAFGNTEWSKKRLRNSEFMNEY
ncbi:hypothetical protein CROQUDRAFT_94714, partial [Cronartium quercuum f. sp. fusiforme G11]